MQIRARQFLFHESQPGVLLCLRACKKKKNDKKFRIVKHAKNFIADNYFTYLLNQFL